MSKPVKLLTCVLILLTHVGHAETLRIAKIDDRYICMVLNVSPAQAADPAFTVPVRDAPSTTAAEVGIAMPTLAIKLPVKSVNGFLESIFPSGKPVWIPEQNVRPYRSVSDPAAKCRPPMMSNALHAFDFSR